MPALALRVPTGTATGRIPAGGNCYILFGEPEVTVQFLIEEKVRAELRKFRAGGISATSIKYLLPPGMEHRVDFTPSGEAAIIGLVLGGFNEHYELWIDGVEQTLLHDELRLTRRTNILFVTNRPLTDPVLQDLPNALFGGPR